MLKSNISRKLLIFALLAVPKLAYANYTITPVKVNVQTGSMISSLTVRNNNDEDRHFQVRVYMLSKDSSTELATKDVIVTPSMFKIKTKKTQLIRIAVKNAEHAFKQKDYMLSIKEVPVGENEENTVKFINDFRIPVVIGNETKADVEVAIPAT